MKHAQRTSHFSLKASLFAGLIVLSASPAFAVAENWQVAKVSGRAWIGSAEDGRSDLSVGMQVASGMTIATGDRSRVMLFRGTESMLIGPKSVVAVSEHPTEGLTTTVLEKMGSVTFDVEKQNVQHFSVETPMLAAVVKGTHFTVSVAPARGNVAVARGTVQVTSLRTGQTTDVTAGQRAGVGRSGGLSVSGRGVRGSITTGVPRAAIVSPVSTLAPVSAFTEDELSAVATTVPAAAQESAVAPSNPFSHAEGPSSANASFSQQRSAQSTFSPARAVSGQSAAATAGIGYAAPSQAGPTASASASGNQSAGNAGVGASNAASASAGTGASSVTGNGTGSNSGPSSTGSNSNVSGGGTQSVGGTQSSGSAQSNGGNVSSGKSDNGRGNGGTPGNGGSRGNSGKSDNGVGNAGTPGNGRGHNR